MTISKVLRPALTLSLASLVIFVGASSSSAHGARTYAVLWQQPVPFIMDCVANTYTRACYHDYDDVFFVLDQEPDGYSAALHWHVPSSGQSGYCVNSHGNGDWGGCDMNIGDGRTIWFQAGRINRDGANEFVNTTQWISVTA